MRISDWSSDVCSSDLRAQQQQMGIRLPSEITRYACLVLFPESLELAVWIVDDQNAPEVPQHALGVDELPARDADEGDGDIGQPNPIQDRKSTRLNSSH